MFNCKFISTLLPTKFSQQNTFTLPFDNPNLYNMLIDSLQYLIVTQPYITFDFNYLSQHKHHPLLAHFQLLKYALQYIKKTISLFLPIAPRNLYLHSYYNFYWAINIDNFHSITHYCSYLGNTLIPLKVRK